MAAARGATLWWWATAVLLALGLTLPSTSSQASDAQIRLLTQKAQLLETLLARSRAQDGLSSDDRATLDVVETLIHVARQDLKLADLDAINSSLDEALRLISQVSRQYARSSVEAERSQFNELYDTTSALLSAYQDSLSVRGIEGQEDVDLKEIERRLEKAKDLADNAHYQQAKQMLVPFYTPLAQALARLRANETVTYQLRFESKEAEFRYELSRIESNRLLVELMVQERAPSDQQLSSIAADNSRARTLEIEARKRASSGDVTRALELAEEANQHLVRALRSAGVYIAQ